MPLRLTFLAIILFWGTMNVLLWRTEYGSLGGDTPVPFALVWRKILTAPDASSLSVYQNRERMGYCEFSTSVGQRHVSTMFLVCVIDMRHTAGRCVHRCLVCSRTGTFRRDFYPRPLPVCGSQSGIGALGASSLSQ